MLQAATIRLNGLRASRAAGLTRPTASCRRPLLLRAYKEDKPDDGAKGGERPKRPESPLKPAVDGLMQQLKKKGISPAKAQELLRAWASMGAKSPEQIKQLLVKGSKQPLRAIGTQALLDVVASAGGFYTGHLAGQADFPGNFFVSLLSYFFACYYGIQAFSGASALLGIYAASKKYDTDGEALALAVQLLAGPGSGNPVLDKATVAINTLELWRTLEGIFDGLKAMQAQGELQPSTLQNLSAYLTLQRAEEVYGFVPEDYGLSEQEAAEIAGVFAMFDANDNGLLEASELRQVCDQLGKSLSNDELKAALSALDMGKTGQVRFNDWVSWWVGRRGAPVESA